MPFHPLAPFGPRVEAKRLLQGGLEGLPSKKTKRSRFLAWSRANSAKRTRDEESTTSYCLSYLMYLIYVLLGIYREYWDILGTYIYIYIYIYTRHIGKLQEDQEGQGIGHQVHVEVVVMDGEISCRHQSLKGNEFRQELC